MPYFKPSWRAKRGPLRWLSRALCLVGLHHWLMSRRMNAPLLCVVCDRKTEHWETYMRGPGPG